MSGPVNAEYVDRAIRHALTRQGWTGTVAEKLTSPLRLKVSKRGYYDAIECITDVGTWGASRVGDLVTVRREGGAYVASRPFDATGRGANVLGEDLRTEETTSHTTWETLLDVDGLAIPSDLPFAVQWKTEIATVGSAGGTNKEVRVVFNMATALGITLGNTSGLYWIPTKISSYAPGLTNLGRQLYLETSDPPSVTLLDVQVVSQVTVQARTNDTGEGNDIVRCTELVVSL